MEYRIVVVSIETELQKISGGEGGLFRKELELNIAGGCLEEDFSSRLGFEVVNGAHDVRDVYASVVLSFSWVTYSPPTFWQNNWCDFGRV